MYIKGFLISYLLLFFTLCSNIGLAQNNLYVSVKDFGAKGDGKTDDTKAIQAAIDYAAKNGFSIQTIPGVYENNTIYFGGTKTVYFPIGIYNISEALRLGSYVDLRGEKAALMPMKKGIGKIDGFKAIGWQLQIEGLQFLNFKTAVNINNDNINVGKLVINNCDFIRNQNAIELNAQSSITIIRENRFVDNSRVLDIIAGDKVDMHNNWVETGVLSGNQPAAIINRGTLHFDNNLMVPKDPKPGTIEPAWINNYSSVYVHGARQGGENGSFTLINNFAEAETKYVLVPNTVIVRDSECWGVYGGQAPNYAPTVIRIFKLPNQILVDGVRGMQDTRVLDVARSVDSKEFQKSLEKYNKDKVQILISNVSGARFLHKNNTDIPDIISKFSNKQ